MDVNANLLDNGGPELTGRPGRPIAVASGTAPACFIDRWWGWREGATGYAIGNLGGSGYPNQIALQRSAGNADTTPLLVGQSTGRAAEGLSTLNIVERLLDPLHGGLAPLTLVFSIYARCGANFSGSGVTLEIVSAAADVNICSGAWNTEAAATFGRALLSSSTWRRFQVAKFGPWSGNPAMVLGVRARFDTPSGAGGSEDALYLTGAKLELSSTGSATSYVVPTTSESLMRCKRLYQAFGGSGAQPEIADAGYASAPAGAGMTLRRTYLLPVEMIRPPVATITGAWRVSNCTQPVVVATTTRTVTLETSPLAAGPFLYEMDSPDDWLVLEAEAP